MLGLALLVLIGSAVADHGYFHGHSKYHGPPAPLNHDGTVAETPEVKHAKAEHFKALSEAKSHGYHGHSGHHDDGAYSHDDGTHSHDDGAYSHGGYKKHYEPAPLNHDGTVADTDDVKHAKAVFFEAYSEAKSNSHFEPEYSSHYDDSHHSYDKKYHGPPAPLNHDGTVAETDDVKHAKAHHFHLRDQALHRGKREIPFQPAPLNSDGTVAETPEIQQAKAAFFAAYAAEEAIADPNWVEPKYNEDPNANNYIEPALNVYRAKEVYQPKHSYQAPSQNFHQSKPAYQAPSQNFHQSKPAYKAPTQHQSLAHYATQPNHYQPPTQKHGYTVQYTSPKNFAPAHHITKASYSPAPHSAPAHNSSPAPVFYTNSQNKPVIPAPLNRDGTVAETPEIQEAKAHLFSAYQEAYARIIPQKPQHPQY